ncbi:MAG: sensor histidine kinase [Bacillota bacterium]
MYLKFLPMEFIINFFEGIFVFCFLYILSGKHENIKNHPYKLVVYGFFYSIIVMNIASIFTKGIHTFIVIITISLIFSISSKVSVYISFLSMSMTTIAIGLSETFFLIVYMHLFKIDIYEMVNVPGYEVQEFLLALLIKLIVLIIPFYILYSKKIKIDLSKHEDSPLIFVTTQLLALTIFTVIAANRTSHASYYIMLGILYIIFAVLGVINFKEKVNMLLLKQNYKIQQEQVRNMEDAISIIRKEKHDSANHLNTIFAMCMLRNEDSLDKIEEYIRKLTNNSDFYCKVAETGINAIDGLLAVKNNYALEHNIYLEINIESPFTYTKIDPVDLSSIIGNLIDNGFEAVKELTNLEDKKVVSLLTYIEDNVFYVSISNDGPKIPEEKLETIFQKGYSTKASTKGDHGYGLYITKQLALQNDASISVTSTEYETEFIVKLPLRNLEIITTENIDLKKGA